MAFHSLPSPIYHGDARIQNVVQDDNGDIIWVDWLCAVQQATRENDLRRFVQSIYGSDVWKNHTMKELLNRYISAAANELQEIMDAIMEFDVPFLKFMI